MNFMNKNKVKVMKKETIKERHGEMKKDIPALLFITMSWNLSPFVAGLGGPTMWPHHHASTLRCHALRCAAMRCVAQPCVMGVARSPPCEEER